jgi:hypothetical protein
MWILQGVPEAAAHTCSLQAHTAPPTQHSWRNVTVQLLAGKQHYDAVM